MHLENNVEFNSALNVEGEPRSTEIKFYYNKKTDTVERISLDSDGTEIPLYPILIEKTDLDYMPNLEEFNFKHRDNHLSVDEYGSFYSESFEELDFALETSLKRDSADKDFLKFLRKTLPQKEYSRFVIEQIAVRSFLHRNRSKVPSGTYRNNVDSLVIEWPGYYPGREKYNMEYLPSTTELNEVYLFSKVAHILNNSRSEGRLKKQSFNWTEIKRIDNFITNNYPPKSTGDMFRKIYVFNRLNPTSLSIICTYLDTWEKKLQKKYEIEVLDDILGNLETFYRPTRLHSQRE